MDYQQLAKEVIAGSALSFKQALDLINTPDEHTFEFLAAANMIKQHFKGNKVKLCAIVNAKSGQCSENCSFCAQSAHHKTKVSSYPLMEPAENEQFSEHWPDLALTIAQSFTLLPLKCCLIILAAAKNSKVCSSGVLIKSRACLKDKAEPAITSFASC